MATTNTNGPFSLVRGYGTSIADPNGTTQYASGGSSTTLNLTAAGVVKATPGRICKIIVLGVVGTGGNLTINDCATTGAATTANQVYNGAGTLAIGTVITLDFPCYTGIVVSAVPTGGTAQFAISWN